MDHKTETFVQRMALAINFCEEISMAPQIFILEHLVISTHCHGWFSPDFETLELYFEDWLW